MYLAPAARRQVADVRSGPDFLDIYNEQCWSVYRFLAYRVESRDVAEDLTQLTFERALRAWPRFDERRASPKTWLLAIARNALIDHRRRDRSSTNVALDELSPTDEPSVAGPEEALALSPAIAAALRRLSAREREVLALRFGGDLRGPEIAELLDLTLANVQQILSRSLRKLRSELEETEEGGRG